MKARILTSASVLCVAIILAGCSTTGPAKSSSHAASPPSSSKPAPTPTAALGTRPNPFPVGTSGKYDSASSWSFVGQDTDPDATATLMAANQFNEQPVAGQAYVFTKFTISLAADVAASGGDPYASFAIAYVGNDGNSYEDKQCDVPAPDMRYQSLGTMYGGASTVGTVCAIVPSGAIAGGAWSVSSHLKSAVAFFVGAPSQ